MDRREAIEWLKSIRRTLIFEQVEAIDLAIEALQEPKVSEDCISRQHAVEDIKEHANTITDALIILENFPPVTPKVSEDCISRQQAIEALMAHFIPQTYTGEQVEQAEKLAQKIMNKVPPVTPPRKVVAEIKVDTEELVKRIKEEYQIEQEHGRLIDADKLLQDLFIVDEEEWTTPEIRAILENAPNITPTERTGEWIEHDPKTKGLAKIYECPFCGDEVIGEKTNYCPNCRAKMKGEEHEID